MSHVYERNPVLRMEQERRARGWNQTTLETKCGVAAQEICRFERGWAVPTPPVAARLAAALGLQPNELVRPATTKDM
jgi:ribosome-binding protein aMBF1 (putative translation factor)